MPDNINENLESLAEQFELLIDEINDVKQAINDNNHPGWVDPEDKLDDLSNAVDTMFIGHAGFYQLAETNSAHIEYPIVIASMFSGWGNKLQSLEYTQPITTIDTYGFNNTYITEIPSADTVQYINEYGLASTKIGRGNAIHLPNIIELGNYCFDSCDLYGFTTGNSLIKIGNSVFRSKTHLVYGDLSTSLEYIGDYAFANSTVAFTSLPDSMKHIGSNPFKTTSCLFTGNMPSSLEYIGDYAFDDYRSSTHHPFAKFTGNCPQNLTYVGKYAFCKCDEMSISGNIFDENTEYDSPHRLLVDRYAFYECTNMTIGGTIRWDESECTPGKYKPELCPGERSFASCENITFTGLFPSKYCSNGSIVDYVPPYVFYQCYNITLEQENLIHTSIGEWAFAYCDHINILRKIETTNGSIGRRAFYSCDELTVEDGIYVNNGSVGEEAFEGCKALNPSIIDINTRSSECIGYMAFAWCGSDNTTVTHPLLINITSTVSTNIGRSCFESSISLISTGSMAYDNILTLKFNSSNSDNTLTIGDSAFSETQAKHFIMIGNIPELPDKFAYMCTHISDDDPAEWVVEDTPLDPLDQSDVNKFKDHETEYAYKDNNEWIQGDSKCDINDHRWYRIITGPGIMFSPYTTIIGTSAFVHHNLTKFILPRQIESIGNYSFAGIEYNDPLRSVTIDAKLKSCGTRAFADHTNLSEVKINEGAEVIGFLCFEDALALTGRIELPLSLEELGDYAFRGSCVTSFDFKIKEVYDDYGQLIGYDGIEKLGLIADHRGNEEGNYFRPSEMSTTVYNDYGISEVLPDGTIPYSVTEMGGFEGINTLPVDENGYSIYKVPYYVKKFGGFRRTSVEKIIFETQIVDIDGEEVLAGLEEFGWHQPNLSSHVDTWWATNDHLYITFIQNNAIEITYYDIATWNDNDNRDYNKWLNNTLVFPPILKTLGQNLFSRVYDVSDMSCRNKTVPFSQIVINSDCLPDPVPDAIWPNQFYVSGIFAGLHWVHAIYLNNVKRIPPYAFYATCPYIASFIPLWIPMNCPELTRIEEHAFHNCGILTNHEKPESMSWSYLYNYEDFREFKIPNSIQYIGAHAFSNVELHDIWFESGVDTDQLVLDDNAFAGFSGYLHVPWSEGDIAGAPWGYTGTIDYDTEYQGYNGWPVN